MFGQKKAREIELIPSTVRIAQEVGAKYIMIECLRCGATWGVTPSNSTISEKDCVCKKCLLEKQFS